MAEGNVVDLFALVEIFIGVTIIAAGWLYILSWFYEARRMMRWRVYAFAVTIGFTLSMVFNAIAMITVVNGLQYWTNIFFYLTVGSLLLTFFGVGMIAKDIASLERLGVGLRRMEKVKFTMKPTIDRTEETGIPCIDNLLLEKPARAPLAIYGQEGTHPWRLAQKFIVTGLLKDEPCIYVTTQRPPELIIEQINEVLEKHDKRLEDFKDNFVIIDCFTPFAGLGEHETFMTKEDYHKAKWKLVEADPRDLNDIHKAYREARKLLGLREGVRYVFDTFSGIAELADDQLLYQYLLHSLTAEEKFRFMSLYLVRTEKDLEKIRYMINGVAIMTLKNGERYIEIDKMPAKFRSGKFKINDQDDLGLSLKKRETN